MKTETTTDIYAPRFVKRLFNGMSSSYERMNFITSFRFSILWRKQFIQKLPDSTKKVKVLDLLSGLGENWKLLIKKYPNGTFYALDFSEEMVQKSKQKNQNELNGKFTVLLEDVLESTLPSNEYDVVYCAFGLKTFNEAQTTQLAQTIHHILKDQGTFTFIEISNPENKLLQFCYSFYLGKIIPILGKLFLGNPSDYKMLWIYTRYFENCKKVQNQFTENKLTLNYHRYFFGCATGFSGKKIG